MIFRSYRKRKAIESYHTILARRLRGLHGKREHYAPPTWSRQRARTT